VRLQVGARNGGAGCIAKKAPKVYGSGVGSAGGVVVQAMNAATILLGSEVRAVRASHAAREGERAG